MRFEIEAGAIYRGTIRKVIHRMGLEFHEDKGWLSSTFYIKATQDERTTLKRLCEALEE